MIIYQSTKDGFLNDAFGQDIETVVLGAYQVRTGHRVAKSEIRAWKESLPLVTQAQQERSPQSVL